MKRILVVDDDRVAARALQTLLELDGYQAVIAGSGAEALAALAGQHFDALVSDLELPGVGGVEVVRAARSRWPDLPILVVTAFAPWAGPEVGAYGVRRVFAKPLSYEDLVQEMSGALPQG